MLEIRVIRWVDSTGFNGWKNLEDCEMMEPDPIVSVGFVLAETETKVVLLQSETRRPKPEYNSGGNNLVIPRVAIVDEFTVRQRTDNADD